MELLNIYIDNKLKDIDLEICCDYMKSEHIAIYQYIHKINEKTDFIMKELMKNNLDNWIEHFLSMYELTKYKQYKNGNMKIKICFIKE